MEQNTEINENKKPKSKLRKWWKRNIVSHFKKTETESLLTTDEKIDPQRNLKEEYTEYVQSCSAACKLPIPWEEFIEVSKIPTIIVAKQANTSEVIKNKEIPPDDSQKYAPLPTTEEKSLVPEVLQLNEKLKTEEKKEKQKLEENKEALKQKAEDLLKKVESGQKNTVKTAEQKLAEQKLAELKQQSKNSKKGISKILIKTLLYFGAALFGALLLYIGLNGTLKNFLGSIALQWEYLVLILGIAALILGGIFLLKAQTNLKKVQSTYWQWAVLGFGVIAVLIVIGTEGYAYARYVYDAPLNKDALPRLGIVTVGLFAILVLFFILRWIVRKFWKKRTRNENKIKRFKRFIAFAVATDLVLAITCLVGLYAASVAGKTENPTEPAVVTRTNDLNAVTKQHLNNEKNRELWEKDTSWQNRISILNRANDQKIDSMQQEYQNQLVVLSDTMNRRLDRKEDSARTIIRLDSLDVDRLRLDSTNKADSLIYWQAQAFQYKKERDDGMLVDPTEGAIFLGICACGLLAGIIFLSIYFRSKKEEKKTSTAVGLTIGILLIMITAGSIWWGFLSHEPNKSSVVKKNENIIDTGILKKKDQELANKEKQIQDLKKEQKNGNTIKPGFVDSSVFAAEKHRADSLQLQLSLVKNHATVDTTKKIVLGNKPGPSKKSSGSHHQYSGLQYPTLTKNHLTAAEAAKLIKNQKCTCKDLPQKDVDYPKQKDVDY